jgi:hypothetical protein
MASSNTSSDSEVFSIKEFFESLQDDNTVIQDMPDQSNINVKSKKFKKFKFC